MKTFTLNRTIGNGSATWGVLTTDADREWSVLTLEARMPPAGGTYRTRLLPPGEYCLLVTEELVAYRGETILMPWLVVRRVPLFPQAALTPEKKIMSGRIIICCRRADEFTPDATDEAVIAVARIAKRMMQEGEEEARLVIVENRDEMQISTYSMHDKAVDDAYEKEMAEKKRRAEFLNML